MLPGLRRLQRYHASWSKQLVAHVATTVTGSTRLQRKDEPIDVAPPWPRRSMRELLIEHAAVDIADYPDELLRSARRLSAPAPSRLTPSGIGPR